MKGGTQWPIPQIARRACTCFWDTHIEWKRSPVRPHMAQSTPTGLRLIWYCPKCQCRITQFRKDAVYFRSDKKGVPYEHPRA
mgnify:FL=1